MMKTIGRAVQRTGPGGEQGQVLALFAGALVLIMGLVGMSVDVGQLVYAKSDLQKVADAAALAAAQDLPSRADAQAAAASYATENGGSNTSATVSFGAGNTSVTVVASRRVTFSFLRVLGIDGADPSARATVSLRSVTSYSFGDNGAAEFAVWAGTKTGNPRKCDGLTVCEGDTVTFRSNDWDADNKVTGNDYQLDRGNAKSNKFKGSFNGGGEVHDLDPAGWKTFSSGGNGNITAPAVGEVIILPLITRAKCTGNCGTLEFTIAAWAAVKVTQSGNPSQPWKGIVLPAGEITRGGETDGNAQPPSSFVTRTIRLTE